jgi:hypothetical protein
VIGSLISVVDPEDVGWVKGSFFNDLPGLRFSSEGDCCTLSLDRDIALLFAGLIQVSVAENAYLRDPQGSWKCRPQRVSIFSVASGAANCLTIAWRTHSDVVFLRPVEDQSDQFEWRVREDAAQELALALFDQLARKAASRDQ